MIVAKTVIPNQYWILREHDKKVGNIEAAPDGFRVRINNTVQKYKSLPTIRQSVHIEFQDTHTSPSATTENSVNGYHTTSRPYNPIFDIRHQIPLWTKEAKSKSWYAAGWYRIKQGKNWSVEECPKLIMLERYTYKGPYKTKEEANDQSVS